MGAIQLLAGSVCFFARVRKILRHSKSLHPV